MVKRFLSILAFAALQAHGQEFTNLNFEDALVTGDSTGVPWEQGAPGWSHSAGQTTDSLYVRGMHLGITQCFGLAQHYRPWSDRYSLLFRNGFEQNDPSTPFIHAFIAQTGTVPAESHFVYFNAVGSFRLMLNNTPIDTIALGGDLHVGDIRSFAGSLAELKIVNITNSPGFTLAMDNITFRHRKVARRVQQNSLGRLVEWSIVNGTVVGVETLPQSFGAKWKFIGEGDFNQDGTPDLLFSRGLQLGVQLMHHRTVLDSLLLREGHPLADGWRPFAVADINADQSPDIVLQNVDGRLAAWLMNGTSFVRAQLLSTDSALVNERAIGACDMDGDLNTDIVLQNNSGQVVLRPGPGFRVQTHLRWGRATATGWTACEITEPFLEDESPSIVLKHTGGQTAVWRMKGTNFVGATVLRGNQGVTRR